MLAKAERYRRVHARWRGTLPVHAATACCPARQRVRRSRSVTRSTTPLRAALKASRRRPREKSATAQQRHDAARVGAYASSALEDPSMKKDASSGAARVCVMSLAARRRQRRRHGRISPARHARAPTETERCCCQRAEKRGYAAAISSRQKAGSKRAKRARKGAEQARRAMERQGNSATDGMPMRYMLPS